MLSYIFAQGSVVDQDKALLGGANTAAKVNEMADMSSGFIITLISQWWKY